MRRGSQGGRVAGATSRPSRVAAVWFPSHPTCGAALAANLAGVPGAPAALVDFDTDWSDASSILLDGVAPPPGPPDDLLGPAAPGSAGVRVLASSALATDLVLALRAAGGGVVALPARLDAADVAAEADVLILGVARGFASLRRARLALDRLPAARRDLFPVLLEDGPSDLSIGDLEDVLGCRFETELPVSGREMALSFERGALAAASSRGQFGKTVAALAERVWPEAGAASDGRRRRRAVWAGGR